MTTEQKIIRAKVGLLELAKQLGNVSQACKIMGYSRDSFYRSEELHAHGGASWRCMRSAASKRVLRTACRRRSKTPSLRSPSGKPAFGQVRIANELRKRGLTVSPAGVRRAVGRADGTLETMKTAQGAGSQERPGAGPEF